MQRVGGLVCHAWACQVALHTLSNSKMPARMHPWGRCVCCGCCWFACMLRRPWDNFVRSLRTGMHILSPGHSDYRWLAMQLQSCLIMSGNENPDVFAVQVTAAREGSTMTRKLCRQSVRH